MPSLTAMVRTCRADRYLAQLCAHLQHLDELPAHGHGHDRRPQLTAPVQQTDAQAAVTFDIGRLTIEADEDGLLLLVESQTDAGQDRLASLIGHRLESIGQREGLAVVWQPAP